MSDPREGLPSASKWERYMHCPGSWNAERAYSQDDETKAAQSGTAIHEALASGNDEDLDEDDAIVKERLVSMRNAAIDEWHQSRKLSFNKGLELIETRLWIKRGGEKVLSGQLDYGFITEDKQDAIVMDYKSGYLPVTPSHKNQQMRVLVVALAENNPELKRVRACITAYRFRTQFCASDYEFKRILAAKREIEFGLWRIKQPDAPRTPGPWCRYCKAKADCMPCAALSAMLHCPRGERFDR